MRASLILSVFGLTALFGGCASLEQAAPVPTSNVTTYYDRNHDGVVDFELHNALVPDGAWSLCDTKFRGRYDLKITNGFTVTKERVDLPVPQHVKITPGRPPGFSQL